MRILGIDPGTLVTGWGLIEETAGRLTHLDNGGIFPPKKRPLFERVCYIHQQLKEIIQKFDPDVLAMEDIFVAKNAASALKLGHARGATMIAAGEAELPLFEYTANQVKKAITGYGHANKEQIQKMVKSLLKLPDQAFTDASDALAVAICHANSYRMLKKVGT
ncbi:MAG: crossover junction endodeoxyribonuclease RuvC [bacterium]|nr:crossover junction endodeoxyribonuclease RuvC [bacterium]